MAVSRYDQRKNYEEEEANAIGTEYGTATKSPLSCPESHHPQLMGTTHINCKVVALAYVADCVLPTTALILLRYA